MNRTSRGNKVTMTRCGRVSTKRKHMEESNNSEVSTMPKRNKVSSKGIKDPAKQVSIRNSMNKNYDRVNKFGVGDMVLAKTGKYPVWPGIVINDPELNLIIKSNYIYFSLIIIFLRTFFLLSYPPHRTKQNVVNLVFLN